jgi:large subunit ribosomal protein L1
MAHRIPPLILAPALQVRYKSFKASKPKESRSVVAMKAKKLLEKKKKKKPRSSFKQYSLKDADQFALCDAIRYTIVLHHHED